MLLCHTLMRLARSPIQKCHGLLFFFYDMLRPTVVFSPSPQPTPYTWPPTTGSLRKLAVSEETGSWYLKVVEPPTQPNTLVCSYLEPQRKYRSYLWRSCGRLGELYQGLQEREKKKNPGPANTLLEPFELNE